MVPIDNYRSISLVIAPLFFLRRVDKISVYLLFIAEMHILAFAIIVIFILFLFYLIVLVLGFHHLQYLLDRFFLDHFFDANGIDILPSFHFEIELCEVVSIGDGVEDLILGRESKFDESSGHFAHFELHNFLEIDIAQIVHNPFDLHMVDVYSGSHVEVVHDFVGHEPHVLLRVFLHKVVAYFFDGI